MTFHRHQENSSTSIRQIGEATTSTSYLFKWVVNEVLSGARLETTKHFMTSRRSITYQGDRHHLTIRETRYWRPSNHEETWERESREQQNCTHNDSLIKLYFFFLFILLAVDFQRLRKFVANKFGTTSGTNYALHFFLLRIKKRQVKLCNGLQEDQWCFMQGLYCCHICWF